MKIQLTERRNVEAEGKWFTAKVLQGRVTVRTDFGVVTVDRTRKGLEVNVIPADPEQQYLEVAREGLGTFDIYDRKDFSVTLRPYGMVQLGEMDKPDLRAQIEKWMARNKK